RRAAHRARAAAARYGRAPRIPAQRAAGARGARVGGARGAARARGEDRVEGSDHPGGGRVGRRPLAQRDRGLRFAPALQARAGRHQDPHGARLRLHARRIQVGQRQMAGRSLRAHLLRMLLPPIAGALALGALVSYFPTIEPATHAYDQALVDIGLAVGMHVRVLQTEYRFELPPAVEQVLRTDRFDKIYYRVVSPAGLEIAGDAGLPAPPGDAVAHNTIYDGAKV